MTYYFYYQIQIFSHKQFSFTSWNHSPLRQNRSSMLKTIYHYVQRDVDENVWVQGADPSFWKSTMYKIRHDTFNFWCRVPPFCLSRSAPWIDGDGRDDGLGCRGSGMCPNQTSTESKLKVVAFLKKGGGGYTSFQRILSPPSHFFCTPYLCLRPCISVFSVQGRGTFIHEKQQLVDGYKFTKTKRGGGDSPQPPPPARPCTTQNKTTVHHPTPRLHGQTPHFIMLERLKHINMVQCLVHCICSLLHYS